MFSRARWAFNNLVYGEDEPVHDPYVARPVAVHSDYPKASGRLPVADAAGADVGENSGAGDGLQQDQQRRIASLESQLAAMQDQLSSITTELDGLRDAGLLVPKSQEHKLKMLLARHTPPHRTDHATKEELLLAARWSQLTYYTNHAGEAGLTVDGWNALRTRPAAEIKEGVEEMLFADPRAKAYPATIARISETAQIHSDMIFVAHESSGGHFDGQVSVWRSDERRVLLVAWRGTDSYAAAKLDAHSAFKVPWATREEAAARGGQMVGVQGANSAKDTVAKQLEDESESPLPHHGLMKHTLMVGKGFLTQYLGERLSVRVKAVVAAQLVTAALGYEIMVCGHSLGAATSRAEPEASPPARPAARSPCRPWLASAAHLLVAAASLGGGQAAPSRRSARTSWRAPISSRTCCSSPSARRAP